MQINIPLRMLISIDSGAMSGLTLGLLSLSKLDLEVLRRSGSDKEKKLATKLIPVSCVLARCEKDEGPFVILSHTHSHASPI